MAMKDMVYTGEESMLSRSDAARRKREEDELKRRASQVREHVPPPKNVSIGELSGLSFEEKATRVYPTLVEQARRMYAAPLNPPPRLTLDWWRK